MKTRYTLMASLVFAGLLLNSAHAITPAAYEHYQKGAQYEQMKDYRAAEQEYRLAIALDPYDSLTYIKLAHLVEQDGKRDEAIQLYERALELNPNDSSLHHQLAQLWEAKNRPLRALEEYEKLLRKNPDYTYSYLPMARLHKALDQQVQAAEAYKAFLKSYPSHYDAQRELAALLLSEKQYDEAAYAYQALKTTHEPKFKDDLAYGIALNNSDRSEEALDVFQRINTPSVVLYEQMGMSYEKLNRLPEAYASYEKAIKMAPQEKYSLYLKLADISNSQDQPEKAISALEAYRQYEPNNGKIIKSLGDLYLKQKDYGTSALRYEEALTQLPASEEVLRAEVQRQLGYSYQMQGRLDRAVLEYEEALKEEDNAQARLNLALAYHQQGRYDEAAKMYRQLLSENPHSETLKKDLGQVLLALGHKSYQQKEYSKALDYFHDAYLLSDGNTSQALLGIANTQYAMDDRSLAYSTYDRLLEKDPDNITARLNKAQLDLEQKNYMQALENLRWVVEKNPEYLEAYKLLAKTHEGLGDHGKTIQYYKKALELQPNDSSLLVGYGNAWRQVGDLERAEKAYEMARVESPENPVLRYNLGSLYNLTDKLDKSIQEYEAALKLNPDFAEPYYGMGTTYEKQKKYAEAIGVYQRYLEVAPPTSSYVPLAKQRIELLQKTIDTQEPAVKPSTKSSK